MADISFAAAGTFAGTTGGAAVLVSPTTLSFGPDGRLYVAEQNGSINAFTVSQDQNGLWEATDHELLVDANGDQVVKNLQNHFDDGSEKGVVNRQVTGLVVAGTSDEPVLYISSSDPNISMTGDINLDTNSGVITQVSFNSTSGEWEVVDLVRGLPRSEENHSVNGMQLIDGGTKLLVHVGGFTNQGAPSIFFANTNEYALSATVLEIDLTAVNALTTQFDPEGGQGGTTRAYKYDLPTLDDPNLLNAPVGMSDADALIAGFRENADGLDIDGPWGGNDGLNMAILPADAPLRIYADGLRNAYSFAETPDGKIFTVDNGGNAGLGGEPSTESSDDDGDGILGEAIGTFNANDLGEGEPLLQVVEGGYYYHGAPVRSNQNQAWIVYDDAGVPDATLAVNTVADISDLVPPSVQIADGFLIDPSKFAYGPGQSLADVSQQELEDRLFLSGITISNNATVGTNPTDAGQPAIEILGSSTNGIVAYDSGGTAFDGAIDGALFVTQFNDNVTLLNINDAGTALDPVVNSGPDDIFGTADDVIQDPDGVLFVANTSIGIPLVNPLDVTVGPDGTLWVAEIGSNQITVLEPSQFVAGPNIDGDNDGLANAVDPFIRDATNGTSVVVLPGLNYVWDFDANQDGNLPGPDGFGGGLTGVMVDGVTDFEAFFQSDSPEPDQTIQLDNVKFITAAGGGTTVVEKVSNGDPAGNANSGEFLFHTGVVADPSLESMNIQWTVVNPGDALSGSFQQIGGYIGTGDQSNYLKLVAIKSGAGELQVGFELGDTATTTFLSAPDLFNVDDLAAAEIVIDLDLDLTTGLATPTFTYELAAGGVDVVTGSAIDLSGSVILDALLGNYMVQGQTTGLAIGLFSTNFGQPTTNAFQAVFQDISITAGGDPVNVAPVAGDDILTTDEGEQLIIPVAALLANDTDLNPGDTLDITAVSNPSGGTVTLDTVNDNVVFTPDTGFTGDATFDYTLSDGLLTDTGMVTVTVSPTTTEDVILYRVNSGGPAVAAIDGGPDWGVDTVPNNSPFLVSAGSNNNSFFPRAADATLPAYVPTAVLASERWDNAADPEMAYAFDVTTGETYQVNLILGNGFAGTSEVGERVFDIAVEGSVVFDDVDPVALFGHLESGLLSTTLVATDDTLNIEFLHDVIENPLVNGIEIIELGTSSTDPISVSIISGNQTVSEADGSVFISILTDEPVPLGDTLSITYTIEGGTATPEIDYAPDESLNGAGTATFTGTASIAGGSSDVQLPIDILQDTLTEGDEDFTVTIQSVSPGYTIGTASSTITIQDDEGYAPPIDTLFGVPVEISDDRLAPTDGGDLSDGDNIVIATQEGELSGANGVRDRDYFTFNVPDGKVLTGIFLDSYTNANPTAPDGFLAIQEGTQITVDEITGVADAGTDPLLGALIYGTGTSPSLNLLDTMAAGGVVDPASGFSLPGFSTPLTGDISVWLNQGAGPGTPTLRFVVEDAPAPTSEAETILAGLTDVDSDGSYGGGAVGSAVLTILDGVSNPQTSNFGANSFQLTNTGDKQIAGLVVDFRDAVFGDSVVDPDGAGGDNVFKNFAINAGGGTGGFVTLSDLYLFPGADPLPNTTGTGVASDGGFDGVLIKFDGTGFDNGETVGFSGDMDPNSIAGLLKTGPNGVDTGAFPAWDIGGVGGAELIGSEFTVLFDDGTTAVGYIGSDGSQAGGIGEAVEDRIGATAALSIVTGGTTVTNGGTGTYGGTDAPEITVSGTPGDTVRVVMQKGFNPVTNTANGIATLVADRLADAQPDFQVNNVFDTQFVDVVIPGSGSVTLASTAFDYVGTISGESFADDDIQPIAFTASVITPVSDNVPDVLAADENVAVGPVSDPIYLTNSGGPVGGGEPPAPTGYFELVDNSYFKFQIEDGSGGSDPGGKWSYLEAPDGDNDQANFQGAGYYLFGSEASTGIDNLIDGSEVLEYTINVPEGETGNYTIRLRASRDGDFEADLQNDVWINFKPADVPGLGDIDAFLTDTSNALAPANNGFAKMYGGGNNGNWNYTRTPGQGNGLSIDGAPGNILAEVAITDPGLYTLQITGRSQGYHIDFVEIFQSGNPPGLSAADSPFVPGDGGGLDTSPTVVDAIDDVTLAPGATLAVDDAFDDADGDTLTYTTSTLPTGVSFAGATGVFTIAPDAPEVSNQAITVTATDDDNNSVSDTFILSIAEPGSDPVNVVLTAGTAEDQEFGGGLNSPDLESDEGFVVRFTVPGSVSNLTNVTSAVLTGENEDGGAVAPAGTITIEDTLSDAGAVNAVGDTVGSVALAVNGPTATGKRFELADIADAVNALIASQGPLNGGDVINVVVNPTTGRRDVEQGTLELDLQGVSGTSGGNTPPVAVDDDVTVNEDGSIIISPLGNDSDADNDTLSISAIATPASNGLATINPDGVTVTYEPDPDYSGSDAFDIVVSDGNGGTATSTVNVTVTPDGGDTEPTLVDPLDDVTLTPGDNLDVSASFDDLDGDTLDFSATGLPSGATISTAGVISIGSGAPEVTDQSVTVTATDDDANSVSDTFLLSIADEFIFNGSQYVKVDDGLTRSQALAEANALGGTLLRIDDPAENAYVFDTFYDGNAIRMDASDVATEGVWLNSDGSAQTYFNWLSPNEPNNFNGNQHWAYMAGPNGEWGDQAQNGSGTFDGTSWSPSVVVTIIEIDTGNIA